MIPGYSPTYTGWKGDIYRLEGGYQYTNKYSHKKLFVDISIIRHNTKSLTKDQKRTKHKRILKRRARGNRRTIDKRMYKCFNGY
jgi:hypothetical protein